MHFLTEMTHKVQCLMLNDVEEEKVEVGDRSENDETEVRIKLCVMGIKASILQQSFECKLSHFL